MIEPYDLVPEPVAPSLPGSVVVRPEPEDVLDAMSADLLIHAQSCVRAFGDFHLALSGHAGLDPVYAKLMTDPAYRWLPWARTQLWIVDETIGPGTLADRFDNIRSSIVLHAGIPVAQVHPYLPGIDDAGEAARLYEREIREALGWREKGQDRIDCVVLFADEVEIPRAGRAEAEGDEHGLVTPYDPLGARDDSEARATRVGMTTRLLRSARMVAVFGSGSEAAASVSRFTSDHARATDRIAPLEGELRWYLDGRAVGHEPGPDDGADSDSGISSGDRATDHRGERG